MKTNIQLREEVKLLQARARHETERRNLKGQIRNLKYGRHITGFVGHFRKGAKLLKRKGISFENIARNS